MRAAVYHGRGDVRVQDVPVPAISEDEILLEVTAVGICGTDAHEYAHGPTMFPIDAPHPVTGHSGPMIPGHEFAGRVAALGAGVDGLGVGDRVATGAGISCGECFPCRRGRSNLCRRYATLGLQRNGGLARFARFRPRPAWPRPMASATTRPAWPSPCPSRSTPRGAAAWRRGRRWW